MRAAIFLGVGGAAMISIGSVVSMTGNNMGQLLNGSRTIFALAENGDLPRWFGKVHPEYRTPSNAILFGAGVALTLALTGSFVALAAVSAIARLVMYLAVCMSTLVLRKRDREIAAQVGAHFSDPICRRCAAEVHRAVRPGDSDRRVDRRARHPRRRDARAADLRRRRARRRRRPVFPGAAKALIQVGSPTPTNRRRNARVVQAAVTRSAAR